MKGMASEQPPGCPPYSTDKAMPPDRLDGVFRAGRLKPTGGGQHRRDPTFV